MRQLRGIFSTRKKLLTGKEVRFLRKEINLTQSELGRLFGVDAQTVARREKGENNVSGPAERLLRALYLEHTNGDLKVQDMLRVLDELDAQLKDHQNFRKRTTAGVPPHSPKTRQKQQASALGAAAGLTAG